MIKTLIKTKISISNSFFWILQSIFDPTSKDSNNINNMKCTVCVWHKRHNFYFYQEPITLGPIKIDFGHDSSGNHAFWVPYEGTYTVFQINNVFLSFCLPDYPSSPLWEWHLPYIKSWPKDLACRLKLRTLFVLLHKQNCQARVQVQGLSQISNKRSGPGAWLYNCNCHPPPPPPTHKTFLSRITLKSLHVWTD